MPGLKSPVRSSQWPARSYSSLAEILGNNDGLAIYRRFSTLNAQNLLYMQSELINLEDDLRRLVHADSRADNEQRRVFQSDISALKSAPSDANEGKQWRKVLEIREKLREYSILPDDALLQHSRLYQLPKPNKHDLRVLREWYQDPDLGGMFMPLPETNAWHEDLTEDLVALSARKLDGDAVTSWITDNVMLRFLRLIGYRFKEQDETTLLHNDRDSEFTSVGNTISIILLALFPPASIFALYYVKGTAIRLGLIMISSAIFTGCLAIFTSATRVEIFVATFALAAVQVVVISTINPGWVT